MGKSNKVQIAQIINSNNVQAVSMSKSNKVQTVWMMNSNKMWNEVMTKSNHIQAVLKISSDGVQGYYLSSLIWTLNAKLYTFVMQGHSLTQENK